MSIQDTDYNEPIKTVEELKDMIKFYILWYLDDEKCNIALTQSKDLSACVDKIIDDLTQMSQLPIILSKQRRQIFENRIKTLKTYF